MTCPYCRRDLTLREYAWTHRHEPPWYIKAIGAVLMGVGIGSVLIGLTEVF